MLSTTLSDTVCSISPLSCSHLLSLLRLRGGGKVKISAPTGVVDEGIVRQACASISRCKVHIAFDPETPITSLADSAFTHLRISSIVIPRTVKAIGKFCFNGSAIDNICFEDPPSLRILDDCCFAGCSIRQLRIPCSVEVLGRCCFSPPGQNGGLQVLNFAPDSRLRRIEASCFSGTVLQTLALPKSLEFIDGSAFAKTLIKSLNSA